MNIMKCIDHVDVDRNWYLMVMRDHNGTGEKNLITFLLKFFPILITLSACSVRMRLQTRQEIKLFSRVIQVEKMTIIEKVY